jgi:hypothetical protein
MKEHANGEGQWHFFRWAFRATAGDSIPSCCGGFGYCRLQVHRVLIGVSTTR